MPPPLSLQNLLFSSSDAESRFTFDSSAMFGGKAAPQQSSSAGSTSELYAQAGDDRAGGFDRALEAAQISADSAAKRQELQSSERSQDSERAQQRSNRTQKSAADPDRSGPNNLSTTDSSTGNSSPSDQAPPSQASSDPTPADATKKKEHETDATTSSQANGGDSTGDPGSKVAAPQAATPSAATVVTASTQLHLPDAAPSVKEEHAAPTASTDQAGDASKIPMKATPKAPPEDPPALEKAANPTLGKAATAPADDNDPADSNPYDPQGGKAKAVTTPLQTAGKQTAKVGQGDAPPEATPSSQPQEASPSAMQLAQTLVSQATSNDSPPVASAVEESKPGSPPSLPAIVNITASLDSPQSTDSAEAAAPAQQLPPGQQDQTFEQVVMGLRGKLDPRNGKADIRLDPPNLGTLHVSLRLTNGALTAEFQSASEVVRDLLSTHMDKLKTVLEGQGVAVDKLAVQAPMEQAAAAKTPPSGSPNHDGRSAGQYSRDPQAGQRRAPGTFGSLWRETAAKAAQDAPIDLVA